MIVKGGSISPGHGNNLANYLLRDKKNEMSELVELRGSSGRTLEGAVEEWALTADGTRCKLPIYSASISPQKDERLTRQQYFQAADILEKKLGLHGQPRAIVIQVHEGREHAHVIWSRIDLETMKAISDSNNFRKHEYAARAMERAFGLERVQGAHAERENEPRPDRSPAEYELKQAERTGLFREEAKRFLTEVWRTADNGQAFKDAIEQQGWVLARGDRRDFVLVDPYAGIHTPARCIEGVRTAEIRDRFKDLDRDQLPSVEEGRSITRDRMAIAARERAEELRRPSDELTRLHWDIPTENRIGRAAIDHAKAVQDLEAERQRRASFGDGDGDMVSEQQAAQRRFAKNSADLEFERQYAKAIEIMRENERKRHEIEEIAPWGEEFKTTPQEREAVEKQQQRPSLDRGRSR